MTTSKELIYTANLMKTIAEFESLGDVTLVAGMDDKRYVPHDIRLSEISVFGFDFISQIPGASSHNRSGQQVLPSTTYGRRKF